MSFYGHHSVQNETFQELLIFRSRYDVNTCVSQDENELTHGNMFWVKTVKDYPYVEISHGKPYMDWATNTTATLVNSPHTSGVVLTNKITHTPNAVASSDSTVGLRWGTNILIPEPQIADTGHVIGTDSLGINMPKVQVEDKIAMSTNTSASQTTYTFSHKLIGTPTITAPISNQPIQSISTIAKTVNKINLGETYNIASNNFDDWGHYYTATYQQVVMPNVTATMPLSATLNNGDAIISHNMTNSLQPAFKTLTSANTKQNLVLETPYELDSVATDDYGHGKTLTQLPFILQHHYPIPEAITVGAYLTDKTGSKTFTRSAAGAPGLNPDPGDGIKRTIKLYPNPRTINCIIGTQSTATVSLILENQSLMHLAANINNTILTIKANSDSITNISASNLSPNYVEVITEARDQLQYKLLDLPPTSQSSTILQLNIEYSIASAVADQLPAINITCTNELIDITNISFIAQDIPPNTNNPLDPNLIEWNTNRILQIPVLEFSQQGHINKVSNKGFVLPEYHINGNTNRIMQWEDAINSLNYYLSNGNSWQNTILDQFYMGLSPTIGTNNSNDTINDEQTISYSAQVYCEGLCSTDSDTSADTSGAQFKLYYANGDVVNIFNCPDDIIEIGQNGYSNQITLNLSKNYISKNNTIKIKLKPLASPSNEGDSLPEDNNKLIHWDEEPSSAEFNIDLSIFTSGSKVPQLSYIWYFSLQDSSQVPSYNNYPIIQVQLTPQGSITEADMKNWQFYVYDGHPDNSNSNIIPLYNVDAEKQVSYISESRWTIPLTSDKLKYLSSPYKITKLINNNKQMWIKAIDKNNSSINGNTYKFDPINQQIIIDDTNLNSNEPNIIDFIIVSQTGKPLNPIKNVETNPIVTSEVEERLSTLEQSMLQLTNISDLKSVNNMESRLKLLEGQLAPVDYDAETEQMAATNRLEEIETKVEETKAATEYNNKDSQAITIEESYKQLLLCYTGLVRAVGEKLYGSNSANLNGFIDAFTLDHYKSPTSPSYLPAGTVPEFTPTNSGGN